MIRAMGIAQAMLFASATIVLGQGSNPHSAPQGAPPPQVLSQTGTMYDGNNANLQLPAEPNRYWVDLWAAPISMRSAGPASTANSVSGRPGAGRH
jgi:hypothetical protein